METERHVLFRRSINRALACGTLSAAALLPADDGLPMVICALDTELVSSLMGRLRGLRGAANVFVLDSDNAVELIHVLDPRCAIEEPYADLTADEDAPGPSASVGMLVAYLRVHGRGVNLAALGQPARSAPLPSGYEHSLV